MKYHSSSGLHSEISLTVDIRRLERDIKAGSLSLADTSSLLAVISKTVRMPKMVLKIFDIYIVGGI